MSNSKQKGRVRRAPKAAKVSLSTRDAWLASIGAMSIGRKRGNELVARLVEQTQAIQQRGLQLADNAVSGVRSQVVGVVGKVQQAAADNIAHVEQAVGGQVARVLSRLGIPSKQDVQELSRRVADLNRQVRALQGARRAVRAAA